MLSLAEWTAVALLRHWTAKHRVCCLSGSTGLDVSNSCIGQDVAAMCVQLPEELRHAVPRVYCVQSMYHQWCHSTQSAFSTEVVLPCCGHRACYWMTLQRHLIFF